MDNIHLKNLNSEKILKNYPKTQKRIYLTYLNKILMVNTLLFISSKNYL